MMVRSRIVAKIQRGGRLTLHLNTLFGPEGNAYFIEARCLRAMVREGYKPADCLAFSRYARRYDYAHLLRAVLECCVVGADTEREIRKLTSRDDVRQ